MFVIRQRHLDAFEQAARESFEDRMVAHVRARFPRRYAQFGEAGVRRIVTDGIERARRYEIHREQQVVMFIRLMLLLRRDFDTARPTRWARSILRDTRLPARYRLRAIGRQAREKGCKSDW